ncbi:MAG: TrmJ/YjtD family RNA methyltransferase [Gammaproteobacteria bacterium]|nr:TrmJ/YjtD family RNA methyltransferase [Gammaproteobacteria bacterium]
MKELNYIRVVLIEPTHPGNIGATARAMANMGASNLALVNPRIFPSPIANARAAGADEILSNTRVFSSLDEALTGCRLVIGTTARDRSIQWPVLEPREAMQQAFVASRKSPVAICFGRESRGMTNEELERCQSLVRIPVEESFSSLNLGSAVMVLLYELRRQVLGTDGIQPDQSDEPKASSEAMRLFYEHLFSVLDLIEFSDGRSTKLHRRLTRLFNRASPYEQEVNMLRGILTAIERKSNHRDG